MFDVLPLRMEDEASQFVHHIFCNLLLLLQLDILLNQGITK